MLELTGADRRPQVIRKDREQFRRPFLIEDFSCHLIRYHGIHGGEVPLALLMLDANAFDALRAELTKRHESFPTRYAIKHYDGDPMRIPTAWLTMRTLRHTCITALHDAGCVREQIRAITGHTIASINEVLDRYTKLTVDQAGAALAKRLEHEGTSAGGLTSADVRPAR